MHATPPRQDAPGTDTGANTQKAATQDRIVKAAVALFAERGYARTSMSAIAEAAGVSRSVIFWHFGEKEGLFREAFRRMLVPFFLELQSRFEHIAPERRLFEIVPTYERVVEEHEETIRSIVVWLLESEDLRAALLTTLFGLHDSLVGQMRDIFDQLGSDAETSSELGAALVSLLDGNLLLDMLDPNPKHRELRRAGMRRLAKLAIQDVAD